MSAAFGHFETEINQLITLDGQNQSRFRAGPGRPSIAVLTSNQMHTITEDVFNRAFRSLEVFFEEVFVLYTMRKPSRSGQKASSYLTPKSNEHAIELMQSGMKFLEWNSPDTLVSRAEIYLKDGHPIKAGITRNLSILKDCRSVRNHIAHNSRDSQTQFNRVLRRTLGTLPIRVPSAGEFLQMSDQLNPGSHMLLSYLNKMLEITDELTA